MEAGPPDRYEPLRELGQGSFGAVHLARDRETGAEVVLKQVRPQLALDPPAVARLQREARVLAALDHPRVLRLLAHGVDGDRCWFVYPYLPGETLAARLCRDGRLPLGIALALAADVAEGLAYVHGRGLVHRDLKPANLLVTGAGRAVILDFGLARERFGATVLTATGELVGTPAYAAPGQIRGEPPDPRDDLYALGLLLYEMLAGSNPMGGGPVGELLQRQLFRVPAPLQDAAAGVPRPVGLLVARLLAKSPADRLPSAAEVCERLGRLVADPGSPPQPAEQPGPEDPTLVRPTLAPARPSPPAGRRLGRPIALALALAALGLVLPVLRGRRDAAPAPAGAPLPSPAEAEAWSAFLAALRELPPPEDRPPPDTPLLVPARIRPQTVGQLAWWVDPRTPLRARRLLDALAAWLGVVSGQPYRQAVADRVLAAGDYTVAPWLGSLAAIEPQLTGDALGLLATRRVTDTRPMDRIQAWEQVWGELLGVVEAHCDGLPRVGSPYAAQLAPYQGLLRAMAKSPRMAAAFEALAEAVDGPAPDPGTAGPTATALCHAAEVLASRLAQARALRSEPGCRVTEALLAYGLRAGDPRDREARTRRLVALLAVAGWSHEAWSRDRGSDPAGLFARLCDALEAEPGADLPLALERIDYLLTDPATLDPGLGVRPPALAPDLRARLLATRARLAGPGPASPPGTPAPR